MSQLTNLPIKSMSNRIVKFMTNKKISKIKLLFSNLTP